MNTLNLIIEKPYNFKFKTMQLNKLSLCLMSLASIAASGQAEYDFSKLRTERLGRGVVAVRESPSKVVVSWRYLSSDPESQSFDIYRNGKKINGSPISDTTFFIDNYNSDEAAEYTVKNRKGESAVSSYAVSYTHLTLPTNREV